MQLDLNNLPSDPELLHRLVRNIVTTIEHRDGEIERLKSIIKQLQRMQFGRRSERIDPDQLALGLEEDVDSDIAQVKQGQPATAAADSPAASTPRRKPLPDHLPREDVRLDVDDKTCSCCGGALHPIGESISEMLDWVPAQLRVIRVSSRNRRDSANSACRARWVKSPLIATRSGRLSFTLVRRSSITVRSCRPK